MKKQKDKQSRLGLRKLPLKLFSKLCLAGMLICGSDLGVLAAGNVYTAAANPYYRHPVTGIVEDAGNNEGIGQGMTESVLNPVALIEETGDGTIYVTVRYYLAEYISGVQFWTQKREDTDWNSASYTITQENLGGEYCTDYRLEIPTEDAVVKSSFFVSPMGRDVIFYMDFSDFTEGNGDFIVTGDTGSAVKTSDNTGSQDIPAANVSGTGTAEEESGNAAVTEAETGSARALIASAQGLVLSDETLLGTGGGTNTLETGDGTNALKTVDGTNTSEAQVQGADIPDENGETSVVKENPAGDAAEEIIPALSWKLVWQCIMIITLPGFLVGGGLLILLNYLKEGDRRNEKKEK
jgi:hypothetical protein